MYVKKVPPMPARARRRGLLGLGGFSDSDQCSTIPIGDPYRKPGNYCATPDGGMTTFNADGSTYRQPGYTVDPDPAHPSGPSGGGSGSGTLNKFLSALFPAPTMPTGPMVPVSSGGIGTGTAIAIAGGVVVLALLLSRR